MLKARLWTIRFRHASLAFAIGFGGQDRLTFAFLEPLFVSQNIVHVAALLYLAGFLFRDQIILRGLILVGDLVYILYFYFAPEQPLWGGIFWSALFTLVNMVMIWLIFFDQVEFSLSANEKRLFDLLGDFTPGQFRQLMGAGRQEVATSPVVATTENERLDHLYFISEGKVTIEKAGQRAVSEAKTFIGEIAFLLSRPATATVTLEPGCHYCVWESKTLRALLARKPALSTALRAAMNRKLAEKVAQAGVLTDITGGKLEAPGKPAPQRKMPSPKTAKKKTPRAR